MTLTPGTRFGRYEVVALLGAGGMGEVYRARDTVLNRDVALKVLPGHLTLEPERLARFTREAQVLASLSHAHIAGVYGLEEGGSSAGPALAMELVEGPTLSERIAQGPVPVDEALSIARQIAEALEVAHERGVIHRDLKPANIKLRPDGSVTVLDFGLAKLAEGPGHPDAASRADVSASPTMISPAMMTGAGVILGTAAYMSPEQARGKEVDRRADIWAFGVVLYEMITGVRPFRGDAVTEVAGAVIYKDPDWKAVDAKAPAVVGAVLRRCLEKDPKKRIRDIADVWLALEGAFETTSSAPTGSGRGGHRAVALLATAAAGALIAGATVWSLTRPQPATGSPVRFIVPPPPQAQLGQFLMLSPDGANLAFFATEAGVPRLWVHSFATGETRAVVRAGAVSGAPFWSPDSRFIGYTDNNGQLSRIDPTGGPPEVIAAVPSFAGGSWSQSNVIVYASPTLGIMQVPANGGSPMALTKVDPARKESSHTGPWFLPGGRRFLYLRSSGDAALAGVYVGELDTPPEEQSLTRIVATEQNALYAPSSTGAGHLLFMRDRTLFAQAFDPDVLTLSGESIRIADEIGTGAGSTVSYGYFTTSGTGLIAYRRGQSTIGTAVWVSRAGQEAGAITPALDRLANPRLSPDGKRVAMTVTGDLWVYDIEGRPPIKLTSGGFSFSPLWSPDGRQLAFEQGTLTVGLPSDGSNLTPEPMSPAEGHFHPFGWSRDGAELILIALPGSTKTVDILRYSVATKSIEPFLATPDNDGGAGVSLSPDGRWLAYVSNQTGRPEIWVRPYPSGGAPVRISPNSGFEPTWSRDGRELYYREQTRLMVVPVNLSGGFNFMPATTLFESRYLHASQPPTYDVAADGRFVMIKPADASVAPFNVVLNWAIGRTELEN